MDRLPEEEAAHEVSKKLIDYANNLSYERTQIVSQGNNRAKIPPKIFLGESNVQILLGQIHAVEVVLDLIECNQDFSMEDLASSVHLILSYCVKRLKDDFKIDARLDQNKLAERFYKKEKERKLLEENLNGES